MSFGPVRLRAVFDLVLGVPTGSPARSFIVDFKTGDQRASHRQDLHFYALVETLRAGSPAYRVATHYLDGGTYCLDDVDEPILRAASRRVVRGRRRWPGPSGDWSTTARAQLVDGARGVPVATRRTTPGAGGRAHDRSDGVGAPLAGTDAHDVVHRRDPHLPVTDLSRPGRGHRRVEHGVQLVLVDHQLHPQLGTRSTLYSAPR